LIIKPRDAYIFIYFLMPLIFFIICRLILLLPACAALFLTALMTPSLIMLILFIFEI